MKISNSKKELAKIISENGGWRDDANWVAMDGLRCGTYNVAAYGEIPVYEKVKKWHKPSDFTAYHEDWFQVSTAIKNFHQTILSHAEYLHLYPAPDADGWIEWKGGECPVERGALIDVRYRCDKENIGVTALLSKSDDGFMSGLEYKFMTRSARDWSHDGHEMDIIAYRLHKPENNDLTQVDDIDVVELKSGQAKSTAAGDDEANLAAKEELEVMELSESAEVRANLAKIYAPSIESLAADYRNKLDYADRKQDEADKANAESDAALSELEKAISAIGFAITPIDVVAQEPELVIADWRDLQIGDEIECIGDWQGEDTNGRRLMVIDIDGDDNYQGKLAIRVVTPCGTPAWGSEFTFIRRPAK